MHLKILWTYNSIITNLSCTELFKLGTSCSISQELEILSTILYKTGASTHIIFMIKVSPRLKTEKANGRAICLLQLIFSVVIIIISIIHRKKCSAATEGSMKRSNLFSKFPKLRNSLRSQVLPIESEPEDIYFLWLILLIYFKTSKLWRSCEVISQSRLFVVKKEKRKEKKNESVF